MNLRFFEISHDEEKELDGEVPLPGPELLLKTPNFDDKDTKLTTVIFTLVICSIIVIFFKENKNLAKLTKYLMIVNIVYLMGGMITGLVRIDRCSFMSVESFPLVG